MSAILTAIEFVLATATLFCLRPILSAIWLYRLHRRGSIYVGKGRERCPTWGLQVIGLFVAGLFAVAVLLVELKLRSSYTITSTTLHTDYCLDLQNRSYQDELLEDSFIGPLVNFRFDEASLDIIASQYCKHGLHNVDLGRDEWIEDTILTDRLALWR